MSAIFENYHYSVVIILMMVGLFTVFSSRNLIKKLVGLSVFQTSVFLMYITTGKVSGGQPPILVKDKDHSDKTDYAKDAAHGAETAYAEHAEEIVTTAAKGAAHAGKHAEVLYSNPLPHVLILTAIVVGVATLAIGLALVVRIREVYGTIEEDEINEIDYRYNLEGTDA